MENDRTTLEAATAHLYRAESILAQFVDEERRPGPEDAPALLLALAHAVCGTLAVGIETITPAVQVVEGSAESLNDLRP